MKSPLLKNVLHSEPAESALELDGFLADALKRAARVWLEGDVNRLKKPEVVKSLKGAFKKNGKRVLESVTDDQRKVLEVIARHGTHMGGSLLTAELVARGVSIERKEYRYGRSLGKGPAEVLESQMILVPKRNSWSSRNYQPEVLMLKSIGQHVEPAEPLPWSSKCLASVSKVTSTGYRSSAEVQLDFWAVHTALVTQGSWKPLKGGALPKSIRNRVKKAVKLPDAATDSHLLPDPESFYYELMCGIGVIEVDEYEAVPGDGKKFIDLDPGVFVWHLIRAWMHRRLWQDGIGVVPDRDNDHETVRIEPASLAAGRTLVIWTLQRLAHSEADWVDLEAFLTLTYKATNEDGFKFYWGGGYSWNHQFKTGKEKDKQTGEVRHLAYWLDDEGSWAGNAIMVTLHALGLIERGTLKKQPHFRLTPLGRQVFGAPEIRTTSETTSRKFLVVQPNFDVTVYLREMDGRDLQQILPFLNRTSTTGGEVQGFRLERERVYQALEQGLTVEEIRQRLTTHAREAIPQVVERALSEWSGKRESLTLRRKVGVLLAKPKDFPKPTKGAAEIGPGTLLVSATVAALKKRFPKADGIDHAKLPNPNGMVTAEGELEFPKADTLDTVAKARLLTLAEAGKTGQWVITAQSIKQAATLGIPAAQTIAWLTVMLLEGNSVPPILATAIRNWTKSPKVFFGSLCVVQIPDAHDYSAVCHSEIFAPMIVGILPPYWIVFHADHGSAVEEMLEAYGFNLAGTPKLAATTSVEHVALSDQAKPIIPKVKKKAAKPKMPRKRRSRRSWRF